jgi:glycine dehydrogenase
MPDTIVSSRKQTPVNESQQFLPPLANEEFIHRHIGPSPRQITEMLAALGLSSLEELIATTVPADIRLDQPIQLTPPQSEQQALKRLRYFASKNQVFKSYLGMGYYGTHVPPVIQRNVLENPGWYTAYTPYQAEISQGRLEALLNFQQMVMDLTGMEMANASLLDEATAAAEAMALARRSAKSASSVFFVADDVHPQTIDVVRTRAKYLGFEIVVGAVDEFAGQDFFGALLQYPGTFGDVRDFLPFISQAHDQGALVAVACDLLSLTLLKPPGELQADIAVGSAQRFGVPM